MAPCRSDADDGPTRDSAVKRLVKMLKALIASAEDEGFKLAPFIGIACPGVIESDGFNRLVLRAGLRAREVGLVRCYGKYLRQIGFAFSQNYIEECLTSNVHIARLRRKIDADEPVKLIQTVRGVGFTLREEEA